MFIKRMFFLFIGMFSVSFALAGPFGIEMGASLDELKQIYQITPQHLVDDIYEIIPPNTHNLFEKYIIRVDTTYGVYYLTAFSKYINTNGYGKEIRTTFDTIVESIEKTYGNYELTDISKSDNNNDNVWTYNLRDGDRELHAIWARKHQSKLPDDIGGIVVWAGVTSPAGGNMGFIVLEYSFSNETAVKEKNDNVF